MTTAGSICPTKMMYIPNADSAYAMIGLANAYKNGTVNPSFIGGANGIYGNYGGYGGYGGLGGYYGQWSYPIAGFENNNQRIRSWEEGQQVRANQLESSQWAGRLARAVVNNETSHIMSFHDKFLNAVKNEDGYKQLRTEGERQAYIEQAYSNIARQSLEQTIDENSDSDIVAGLKNGLSFGLFPKKFKSANTLKEELLGIEKPEGSATAGILGRVLGGVATGAAIGTLTGIPVIGTIGGAVLGGLSSLWS